MENFSRGSFMVGIGFTDVTAAAHTLNCSSEDDFKEGDNQAEDQLAHCCAIFLGHWVLKYSTGW